MLLRCCQRYPRLGLSWSLRSAHMPDRTDSRIYNIYETHKDKAEPQKAAIVGPSFAPSCPRVRKSYCTRQRWSALSLCSNMVCSFAVWIGRDCPNNKSPPLFFVLFWCCEYSAIIVPDIIILYKVPLRYVCNMTYRGRRKAQKESQVAPV